jgi:hypothetical protein
MGLVGVPEPATVKTGVEVLSVSRSGATTRQAGRVYFQCRWLEHRQIPIITIQGGKLLRRVGVTTLVLMAALTGLARSLPNDPPALRPTPGTGMFLMLSDIHFDPYSNPAIMKQLGAVPLAACQAPASGALARFGSDTNYPLLKSTLANAAATAAQNHFQYDYVMVSGDFLAHGFEARYRQCVGGGAEAYQKFAANTIRFVDSEIAKALPGVPVFAALGNNDSDKGDYAKPSNFFLESVGEDWSRAWGNLPAGRRDLALASLGTGGNYALPHPTVPNHELIILNSNLWSANNAKACGDADPDPGGQFEWLEEVLGRIKRAGGTATLIMHVLPGIDALKSAMGEPRAFWTDRCTEKLVGTLTDFRAEVREIYAGHIHRDDFRIFPDREGKPLLAIHVVPAVSPVYLNNPAVEIGWYDETSGELRDYAPLYLDLGRLKPAWATEYRFTQAYGYPRPDLVALEELNRALHAGNSRSGVGRVFANNYGAGIGWLMTSANWLSYSCAQTEITLARYVLCTHGGASR